MGLQSVERQLEFRKFEGASFAGFPSDPAP